MIYIVALYGIVLGSFYNVCIYRIPEGTSLKKSSRCTKCKRKIKKIDLIPIISFLILKGKSRCCKEKISKRYLIVEILTGILFASAF